MYTPPVGTAANFSLESYSVPTGTAADFDFSATAPTTDFGAFFLLF